MSTLMRTRLVTLAAFVATFVLHVVGSGSLATPPLGSWASLDAWYVRSGPAVAIVALVRLVALGAGGWLVIIGVLQLLAPVVDRDRFSAMVDGLSPRFLRAVSKSAAGLSVTAGLALPGLPSGAADNPPGTAVMVPLDAPADSPSTSVTTSTIAPPAPTSTTALPTTSTSTTAPTTSTTTAPTPTTVAAAEVVAPEVRHDEVVVDRGDSFWSIAEDEAGERELVAYWRALIELNRDRLVDPSNPDLLYPDQVLRLP